MCRDGDRVDSAIPSRLRRARGCEVWHWRTTGQIPDRNRSLHGFPNGITVIGESALGANRYRRKPEDKDSQNGRHEAAACFPNASDLYRLIEPASDC